MISKVKKRDGKIEPFDQQKIVDAIMHAMVDVGEEDKEVANRIAVKIASYDDDIVDVETIQDMVEANLMASRCKRTARGYILYRDARNKARGRKQADLYRDIIATESNDVTRDNANMNADTPAGMMMKFAAETSKPFVDDYLLSAEAKEAVVGNYIHIHDKDYYPTKSLTCIQHPLDKILARGFRAGHGASRPAKRIETATILAAISLECVQNEMHGGQAIPAFDFMLAPYVSMTWVEEVKNVEEVSGADLKDYYAFPLDDYEDEFASNDSTCDKFLNIARNRTINRVHQAMEAFIHNMNTIHSRGGNQVNNTAWVA